ncbi:MAG: hypothetical protein QOF24_620 [Verrucomicrobiota bacterium]|jgi:hypothetical protein
MQDPIDSGTVPAETSTKNNKTKKMKKGDAPKASGEKTEAQYILRIFSVMLIIGIVGTCFWIEPKHAMLGLIWALACFVGGSALGFIFGIPKVLQAKQAADPKKPDSAAGDSAEYRQQVNTNLTEISDWLTKMIVGVTLVNLKEMPPFIKKVSLVLANAMSKSDPSRDFLPYAVAVSVYFAVLGFLFGYLMTRLYLAAAFARADIDASSQNALSGDIASIRSELSVLADVVKSKSGGESGNLPENTRKSLVPSPSPQDRARAAAENSLKANSIQDEKQRIAEKDKAANEIATLVVTGGITKDWLIEEAERQAVKNGQDGLIAGLSLAINSKPEEGDLERLLRVAGRALWPNAQHKVCVALIKLFSSSSARKEDVPRVERVLKEYLLRPTLDKPLKDRIIATAAVITRSTSIPLNLPFD